MEKTQFNSVEVLEMAKEIEVRGKEFYRHYAQQSDKKELKDFFKKLARDEQDHYDTFNKLSQEAEKKADTSTNYIYDYQVSNYLKNLVEFTVFPADENEMPEVEELNVILNIAITAEKDSILFYQEMVEHNQGNTVDVLEKLIKEEKKHLQDLIEYRGQNA